MSYYGSLQGEDYVCTISSGESEQMSAVRNSYNLCYLHLMLMQILDKGELQVAGKEREIQFASQFRDIATIVMQRTINPETQRPYTISMIERLMHETHFAVDPNSNSKKQVSRYSILMDL